MTITAGNSNNGIPMGGYVPGTGSGGGGGVSGDVYRYKGSVPTYTALPAENLETGDVYNVIDTDMNYAWTGTAWDPLGSTVDLSPYYTANQVDAKLSQKQGLLTPQGALSINTYVKSNLHGMSYIPDGTGIYSTTNWGLTAPTNNSSAPFSFNGTFASSTWGPNSIPSYISIPYSMGQIVITPVKNYYMSSSGNIVNHYSTICAWAGKTLEDGTFIPILPIRAAGTYRISSASSWSYSGAPVVTSSDIPTTNTATSVVFSYTTPSASSQTNIAGSIGQPSGTNVFQMFEDEDTGAISIYIMSNSQSASRGYTYTDLEVCARLKEIDSVLFIPSANGGSTDSSSGGSAEIGVESTTAVNVGDIGLYSANTPVTELTFTSLGENLFDLTGETAKNYLELAIDNNTLKINSNNQLYADIDTTAAVATADTAGIVRPTGDVLSVNAEGDLSADTYNTSTLDTKFEEKQNILTATNGISIERKTISNVEGFSYTSDSSAIYNTGGWGVGAPLGQNWVVYQVPGIADLVGTSMTATTFPNRIVMPYTFGQIVKYPSVTANEPINIAFGKLTEDGTFYPIWFPNNNRYYYKSDNNIIQKPGNFEQIHFNSYADWGSYGDNFKTDAFTYNDLVQYMQLKVTDSDLKLNWTYGSSNHSYMYQFYKTDVSILNRFREVNAVMIIPYYMIYSASSQKIGVDQYSAIPVTSIGLYANTMDLYDNAEQLDTHDFGENLFDIGGVQAHNYISINTDNSTIKVNDSGQLYAAASIPENVTTQGNTFNGANQLVQLDSTGKLPAVDGSNLTNIASSQIQLIPSGTDFNNLLQIGTYLWTQSGNSSNNPNVNMEGYLQVFRPETNKTFPVVQIYTTCNNNTENPPQMYIRYCIDGNGGYSWTAWREVTAEGSSYTLPAATADTLGGIKVGSNLAVTDDGTLSATYIPATTTSLGAVKPDGTTVTIDEDGTIHSTQEGFADLAANNVFTGTNQFQNTVTVGNGFNTAVLNMGPGSGLIFENSSQAGGKKLSLGTQTGTQVTIYSDGVPIIQRSETRTNQSSSDDNPYTKYNNVDSGNINDILGISFWKGTQTEYDGITEKDANTLYIITG